MRSTPFNTRSSEWIGDMTVYLRETGEDNSLQMERLRRNLRRAREQELTPRQRQMLSSTMIRDSLSPRLQKSWDCTPTVSRTLGRARERLRRYLRYTL